MLDKQVKPKDVDRIIQYVNHNGQGKNPIELSEKEQLKLARINYAYEQRKAGWSRKDVVNMIMKEYAVSISTAYLIVGETEMMVANTQVAQKSFAKTMAEEWCLKGIRQSIAAKDLTNLDRFVGKYMKLHGLFDPETESIPGDVLKRNIIYLTHNPEDVGMERLTMDEIKAFYEEKQKKPAPRLIQVEAEPNEQDTN